MNKDLMEFTGVLVQEFSLAPHIAADTAQKLSRLARSLNKINENECNIPNYDGKKREAKLQEQVTETLREIGYEGKIYFNGDPRGLAVGLYLPSGRRNSWDGETWRIPE